MNSRSKKKNNFYDVKRIFTVLISLMAGLALVITSYSIFKPKGNIESKETNIAASDLAKFPASLSGFNAGQTITNNGGSPYFPYKTTSSYAAFCTSFQKDLPSNGATCKLITDDQWGIPTSSAIGAIVAHSYVTGGANVKLTDTNKYYIGELAINRYFCLEKNSNNPSVCDRYTQSVVQSFNYEALPSAKKTQIDTLVEVARAAKTKSEADFTVKLSPSNLTFTKVGDNYVSNDITVSANYMDSWKIVLTGATANTTYKKSGNKFNITVPVSDIAGGKNISITATVTATKTYKLAAKYNCGSNVQYITPSFTVDRNVSSTAKVSTNITKPQISVGKIDAASEKYISGAKLLLTGPNGFKKEITSTDTLTVIDDIEYGEYTLQEISAPNGYVLNTEVKKVTLSDSRLTAVLTISNYPTGITISKRSINGNSEIPGAELRIVDEDGNVKYGPWTTTTSKKVISGLKAGDYYLEETKAPTGYRKSDVKVKFTLKTDGTVLVNSKTVQEITFTNEPIEVTISKTDIANSKELPGAQLQILDESGNSLYKWISTNEPHVISMIPAGTYYLEETQEPTGYVKRKEKIKFEIDKYGNITVGGKKVDKVVMTNEKTKVNISKQDVTNGKEIPGAELQVQDASGKVVDKWTSTSKVHTIEGLTVGKYYLTEKIAPKGYVVSEEKIEFIIKNDGTVDTVVMLNTPIVDVPDTLGTASIITTIVGIIAIVFGGWMIYNNVKNKKA